MNDRPWIVIFPLRIILYLILMIFIYPIILLSSWFYAIYLRLSKGKVTDILKCGGRMLPSQKIPYEETFHYAAMVVFKKPFSDRKRANDILIQMAKCVDIPKEKVAIIFEDSTTTPTKSFPPSPLVNSDYYVLPNSNFLKEADAYKHFILYLRIWNSINDNEPTVVIFNGVAATWDGSSNFNFMREFSNRYWNNIENPQFFQGNQLVLNASSKDVIDSRSSFLWFLIRMPYNLYWNCSSMIWQFIKAAKWSGGSGISMEATLLNFNQTDSQLFTQGTKLKGVKPFAAMTYAAVKAYRKVLKANPHAIVQQSSLMTRHYSTNNQGLPLKLKGRNYVGDWLIGPLQFIGSRSYTPLDAETAYQQLMMDLDSLNSSDVIHALEAKAWGWMQGSSGVFECLPSYNDASIVFDSIFFNNYGIRDMAAASTPTATTITATITTATTITATITTVTQKDADIVQVDEKNDNDTHSKANNNCNNNNTNNNHKNNNITTTTTTTTTTKTATTTNTSANIATTNTTTTSDYVNSGINDDSSPFVSWSWGAPFRLGFNTIHINQKTCITLASCVLGLQKLEAIRDCVLEILQKEFIDVAKEYNHQIVQTQSVVCQQ